MSLTDSSPSGASSPPTGSSSTLSSSPVDKTSSPSSPSTSTSSDGSLTSPSSPPSDGSPPSSPSSPPSTTTCETDSSVTFGSSIGSWWGGSGCDLPLCPPWPPDGFPLLVVALPPLVNLTLISSSLDPFPSSFYTTTTVLIESSH